MNLVCISTHNRVGITKGKSYDILNGDSKDFYTLKNDLGDNSLYPKKLFKPLNKIRESQINKILSN